VGTFGGSQDHTAILCCKPDTLSQYRFCPVVHERDVPMPADHVLAVAVSGVVAEKTGAARSLYNRASEMVGQILGIWNRETLREDASLAAAVRSDSDAADRLRDILRRQPMQRQLLDRFEQFVRESEYLVPAASDALLEHDLRKLGVIVAESQSLAERLLKNQVPETTALARLARECGAVAASAFGAGFGGSVWAMARRESADVFLDAWRSTFGREHPRRVPGAQFFITSAASAATCEPFV
jgi:galactokinase